LPMAAKCSARIRQSTRIFTAESPSSFLAYSLNQNGPPQYDSRTYHPTDTCTRFLAQRCYWLRHASRAAHVVCAHVNIIACSNHRTWQSSHVLDAVLERSRTRVAPQYTNHLSRRL
jgi:hypothetical protein